MMDTISLKNIRVYAYHGCLSEETLIGSDYRVDLKIKADLHPSAKSDLLEDTVDYVLLNRIVKEEMKQPSRLLESVCMRILSRILNEDGRVIKAEVEVCKLNPPLDGDVKNVCVKMLRKRKKM